jgi:diguanylate cyclase (GGDEF)-like protein/PAS domain S-box-containing protein
MARLPATHASKQDYERAVGQAADLGLFSAGGSFERFPGAVLLAGQNNMVLGANATAEPIAALLKRGGCAELSDAIDVALAGRAAQVNPLLLPPGDDAKTVGLAFDVAVLPWCDGAAALLLGRDVTLERSLRSALIESRQRYKDLVEAACDFAWETDAEGRFTFVSSQGALGYSAAQLVGAPALYLRIDQTAVQDSPFSTRAPVQDVEIWLRAADGEAACLLLTGLPLTGPDGAWCGTRGLCRNITQERTQEAELAGDRQRERLLSYVLGIVRDEMEPTRMLTAAAGALVPALPAAGACIYRAERSGDLTCAAQAGVLPPEELLAPALRQVAVKGSDDELEVTTKVGALFAKATRFEDDCNVVLCVWREGVSRPWNVEDRYLLGEIAAQVGLASQQLARQEELEELSATDSLTGLLNRRSFMEELEKRYSRRPDRRGGAALLFIDLDNFKPVNDRHGHQQGDLALTLAARILREQTRGRDLVARLGGDEFALFIEDITPAAAEYKGRELLRAGRELEAFSGAPDTPLGLSVGIAACDPEGKEGLQELIERADQAMYRVKRRGKGDLELSLPAQSEDAR